MAFHFPPGTLRWPLWRKLYCRTALRSKTPSPESRPPALEIIIWIEPAAIPPATDPEYEGLLASASADPLPPCGPGDDAVAQIYYTSGTTGRPKGVLEEKSAWAIRIRASESRKIKSISLAERR